jgi:hypothetical protein
LAALERKADDDLVSRLRCQDVVNEPVGFVAWATSNSQHRDATSLQPAEGVRAAETMPA